MVYLSADRQAPIRVVTRTDVEQLACVNQDQRVNTIHHAAMLYRPGDMRSEKDLRKLSVSWSTPYTPMKTYMNIDDRRPTSLYSGKISNVCQCFVDQYPAKSKYFCRHSLEYSSKQGHYMRWRRMRILKQLWRTNVYCCLLELRFISGPQPVGVCKVVSWSTQHASNLPNKY